MSREQKNGHVESMGIELCLSCGLCCQGVIFNRAVLKPNEIRLAKDNGLDYFPSGEGDFAFRLPCSLYQNNKCSIYLNRPEACRRYRCDLLKQLMNRDINLKESKMIIFQVKSLMDSINKQMTDVEPSADFNQRIIKFLDLQSRNALTSKDSSVFLRDIEHFFVILQKNIERRAI